MNARIRARPHRQQGVTMVVVLVLLSVMLLGGMALARMTEVGTLASGNAAFREASLQASEVGVNTAYQAVRDLTNENSNAGSWYFATAQALDANGVPTVSFDAATEVVVGAYSVRYVVDRVCTGALPVTEPLRQCLVKQIPQIESSTDREKPDPPTARQFRITVRVTGPKDTRAWVQALMTKG
jgi:type IV pilus assembly protein PilX